MYRASKPYFNHTFGIWYLDANQNIVDKGYYHLNAVAPLGSFEGLQGMSDPIMFRTQAGKFLKGLGGVQNALRGFANVPEAAALLSLVNEVNALTVQRVSGDALIASASFAGDSEYFNEQMKQDEHQETVFSDADSPDASANESKADPADTVQGDVREFPKSSKQAAR